jgi:hypothetical protein
MRNRFVRLGVVLVLLGSAGAAAYIVRGTVSDGVGASADLDRRIDRLLELTSALRATQVSYVVPGQDPTAPLARFPDLLQNVTVLTSETGALLRSPEASSELSAFAEATSRLTEVDAAAREQMLTGDVLTASHLIFGDAAQAADAMVATALRMREAERAARIAAAATLFRQNVTLVASVAGLWLLGLLLLALVPIRQREQSQSAEALDGTPPQQAISIGSAADLCTEISRVETTATLNALLARAVSLLEAEGAIVWMESGGELLAVAAAGYAPEVTSRLSSIRRHDDNMTATAWREGITEVVHGGEESGAAIAVPLFGGQACCGVFALELRTGRQPDDLTRDVARMIAAQLASVIVGPANAVSPGAAVSG